MMDRVLSSPHPEHQPPPMSTSRVESQKRSLPSGPWDGQGPPALLSG